MDPYEIVSSGMQKIIKRDQREPASAHEFHLKPYSHYRKTAKETPEVMANARQSAFLVRHLVRHVVEDLGISQSSKKALSVLLVRAHGAIPPYSKEHVFSGSHPFPENHLKAFVAKVGGSREAVNLLGQYSTQLSKLDGPMRHIAGRAVVNSETQHDYQAGHVFLKTYSAMEKLVARLTDHLVESDLE